MPTLLVSSEHFKSVLENLNDVLDDKHVPNQDSTNDKTKVHIYYGRGYLQIYIGK